MTDTISLNFFVWGLLFLSAKLSAIKFGAILFWVPCGVHLSLPFDTLFLRAELVDSFSLQPETPLPSLLQKMCHRFFLLDVFCPVLCLYGAQALTLLFPPKVYLLIEGVCLCAHAHVYQDARGGTVKV